ncbi:MAG: hypothetical protein ACE5KO_03520 [Candidatus Bathyarchaeia archaeon]
MFEDRGLVWRLPISSTPPPRQAEERKLAELVPKTYATATARVLTIKCREKEDELGNRPYVYGIVEDSTFKMPFVCYKTLVQFDKDGVFEFENAYVHEFEDGGLLLVLADHSKISYLLDENPLEYCWQPRIGDITRPLGYPLLTLKGTVSKIFDSSGLVKRCNNCGRIILGEKCLQMHGDGFYWSVRISARLSDNTGSIHVVFNESLTCNLLDRPISDILYHVSTGKQPEAWDFDVEVFTLDLPDRLAVNETVVIEDPLIFRSSDKPIVPDKHGLRIYYPRNLEIDSNLISQVNQLELKPSDENHFRIIAKLVEKSLDIELRKITGCPKVHGIHLLERPIPLFGCERAKLYLGFETEVARSQGRLQIECHPKSIITESLLDYIGWRRERGASVNTVKRALLDLRPDVILAPNNARGSICSLTFQRVGDFKIPVTEQALPDFWKYTHGIEVGQEEKPLIVVKPEGLDVKLTYPPSCVFFDESHIAYSYFKANKAGFIERKKTGVTTRVFNAMLLALENLNVSGEKIKLAEVADTKTDMQRLLIHDVKERLLGRKVKATGSVIKASERLYFLPKTIESIR